MTPHLVETIGTGIVEHVARAMTDAECRWSVHAYSTEVAGRFETGKWYGSESLAQAKAKAAIRATLAYIQGEGFVVLPMRATQEMEDAAKNGVRPYHDIADDTWRMNAPKDFFRLAWKFMISAAPDHPSSPEQEVEKP